MLACTAEVEDGIRQLVLVGTDESPVTVLSALAQGAKGPPAWSPDGRSIAFAAGPEQVRDPSAPYWIERAIYRAEGHGFIEDVITDLYVLDVENRSVQRLTDDRCINTCPRWSPDGRSLAYLVSYRPDSVDTWLAELHVLDLNSGGSTALVSGEWGGVVAAEWSADGERIVFLGSTPGNRLWRRTDLWTICVDRSAEPRCRTASITAGVGLTPIQTDMPIVNELWTPHVVTTGDYAYTGGQIGGQAVVYRVVLDGAERVERAVDRVDSSFFVDAHAEHGVLYLATSLVEPPELVLEDSPITTLNVDLIARTVRPQVRKLIVTASDGLTTDARSRGHSDGL
jgi:dipeptidyl aminopeptidase/acylaminoacyl peptidase